MELGCGELTEEGETCMPVLNDGDADTVSAEGVIGDCSPIPEENGEVDK